MAAKIQSHSTESDHRLPEEGEQEEEDWQEGQEVDQRREWLVKLWQPSLAYYVCASNSGGPQRIAIAEKRSPRFQIAKCNIASLAGPWEFQGLPGASYGELKENR